MSAITPVDMEHVVAPLEESKKAGWCGRVVQSWTQIPVGTGGVVTIAGVLSGIIINQIPSIITVPTLAAGLAIGSGIATASIAIGFFAIGWFVPRKQLEDQIKSLGEENEELRESTQHLQDRIKDLSNLKDSLDKQLMGAQTAVLEIKQIFDSNKGELGGQIERMNIELDQDEKDLNNLLLQLKAKCDEIQKANQQYNKLVTSFDGQNNALKAQIQSLEKTIGEIKGEAGKIDAKSDKISQDGDELRKAAKLTSDASNIIKEESDAIRVKLSELAYLLQNAPGDLEKQRLEIEKLLEITGNK